VLELGQRGLDVAVEVRADRDVVVGAGDRDDAVDVRADDVDALGERLGRRDAVARPVLARDHAHHAAAPADLGDVAVDDVVLVVADPAGDVRRDHRGAGIHHAERVVDRLLVHVRDVDQDVVLGHRPHGGLSECGQPDVALLREQQLVEGVGHERDRRRVLGHSAPEQVRERDVGDALLRELGDAGGDLGLVGPEGEAALDAVDEPDPAGLDRRVERVGVAHHLRAAERLLARDVAFHELDLLAQRLDVARARRRAVGLVEVHLVERLEEHREDRAHVALAAQLDGDRRRPARPLVVEQPREDLEHDGAPRRPRPRRQHGRVRVRLARLEQMHREVGVQVDEHAPTLPGGVVPRQLRDPAR
jgi:hypothetical protein